MPLRLLRLVYAIWFVGVLWLLYLSIVRHVQSRAAGGLTMRILLCLTWPLSLLTRRGRQALLPDSPF
jgi:hypothetical protein